jgi:hypothetical protein
VDDDGPSFLKEPDTLRLENVPLKDIVPNPWRDLALYPLDREHVAGLVRSIHDHEFFESLKGRRRSGKVEIGCGHARAEAARIKGLESIPIYLDDEMDDDDMLRLMTDENATQAGASPGSVMNEVSAVTRRLIDMLLEEAWTTLPSSLLEAFEHEGAIETACAKLKTRLADPTKDIPIGYVVIRRYLGKGDIKRSHRSETEIREAMSALKQSGRYDDIVNEAIRKHPLPVTAAKPAKAKEAVKAKESKPAHRRILDECCANVFPNDHQFRAFREAVTTPSAQKYIPVESQLALAQSIMDRKHRQDFNKKQVGAPFIKMMVHAKVDEAAREQRRVDKAERDAYFAEQTEAEIDAVLHSAKASVRSLSSACGRLLDVVDKYPMHHKITGFSAKLDDLVSVIQTLSQKCDPRRARSKDHETHYP